MCEEETPGMRIGPCVHYNNEGAERLLHRAILFICSETQASKIYVNALDTQIGLRDTLKGLGFRPLIQSVHMSYGPEVSDSRDLNIYFAGWSLVLG